MKCLVFFILASIQLLSANQQSNVVILDFVGDANSNEAQLKAIADKFEVELSSTGVYTILDRSQMDVILQEQGFQSSGACNSNDCQVEIGQLLGVEKILSGKVVKFEDIYSITIQITSVMTGELEKGFSFEIEGTLRDVLVEGCAKGAAMIAGYVKKGLVVRDQPSTEAETDSLSTTESLTAVILADQPDLMLKKEQKSNLPLLVKIGLYSVSAALVGTGYYFGIQAEDAYEKYSDTSFYRPDINSEYTEVEGFEQKRNIFYGLGAAFLAGAISYTIFF